MSNLTEPALEFAKQHVRSFYASDFFPDPDEFDAVWMGWDEVLSFYKTAEIAKQGTTFEDMACAKARGGYRIVHQLLPIDTITYAALASLIAPHLEEKRRPESEGVACSYRIDLDASGQLFKPNVDGYGTFRAQSKELAEIYDWIFVADISGFYNHIYVHRVEGAVQRLDPALDSVASDLHAFLLNLNDRVSIGIPVGPAASIVVAELILNEVDDFLHTHRLRPSYTRYVDDFRFFSNSRIDLDTVWHDLAAFLYRAYRLTLADGKCEILPASRFRDEVLSPPVDKKQKELAEKIGISFADLEGEYKSPKQAPLVIESATSDKALALQSLFSELLSDPELNIGLARQLLRRARSLRMRCIARPVIDSIEKLGPVIRDAGLYLYEVMSKRAFENYASGFERFLHANPVFISASHLHYWIAWLLSGKKGASVLPSDTFLNHALPRFRARAMRTFDRPAWVRENRGQWQKWATWDRWSLLHSAELLPPAERRAWMDSVSKSPDLMDRLIARKVRAL
jgi:hypothetical protein